MTVPTCVPYNALPGPPGSVTFDAAIPGAGRDATWTMACALRQRLGVDVAAYTRDEFGYSPNHLRIFNVDEGLLDILKKRCVRTVSNVLPQNDKKFARPFCKRAIAAVDERIPSALERFWNTWKHHIVGAPIMFGVFWLLHKMGDKGGGGKDGGDTHNHYHGPHADRVTTVIIESGARMLTMGAATLAALAKASKRRGPPPIVPVDGMNIEPPLDTIDRTYIVDQFSKAQAVYEAQNAMSFTTYPLTARQLMWGALGLLAAGAAAVAALVPVDGPFGEMALAKASAACFTLAATSK